MPLRWALLSLLQFHREDPATSTEFQAANVTLDIGTAKVHKSVVRIGLDYKFDWGAPVATRY